ncbi:receptor-type tyrosine-protein phosphatase alpha, partial [Biomphalaria pfeifferi]
MQQLATDSLTFWFSIVCLTHIVSAVERMKSLMERCPDGYFGYKCKFRCQCQHQEVCDKISGQCPKGCKNGFWGTSCHLDNMCYYNNQRRLYLGSISYTSKMNTCQRWEAKVPHAHNYTEKSFPDNRLPSNFCRTTPDSDRPWCYTTDTHHRWGYCKINNCECPVGRFGQNCHKECHCKDDNEKCDSMKGICRTGCARGWSGLDCQKPEDCPENFYGWECGLVCQCDNPRHCDRFWGPTKYCNCKNGFFNPPNCEPVTAPKIVDFVNEKVNSGQASEFNCTIAAYPTPTDRDVSLISEDGKRYSPKSYKDLEGYLYTRQFTFSAQNVMYNEKYTCSIQSTAGSSKMTKAANVFQLPRLVSAPAIYHVSSTNATVFWYPWNKNRGDTGDEPVISYHVYIKHKHENTYTPAGRLLSSQCADKCLFTFNNLQANTMYLVYVVVQRSGLGGEGLPSPYMYINTECAAPKLPVVIEKISSDLQLNETFPKTKVTVKWKDPDLSSINCQRIKKYILYISSELGRTSDRQRDKRIIEITGDGDSVSVPDLEPFMQYCAEIEFQNDAMYTSPLSTRECIVTQSTVPGPPTYFRLHSHNSTAATLTWQPPKNNVGAILKYHVQYYEDNNPTLKEFVVLALEKETIEFTMTHLRPNTYYKVKVKAENVAGNGTTTPNNVVFTTEEGVPGPVHHLTNVSKTTTSLGLQWQLPLQPNGQVLHFEASCQAKESLSNGPSVSPHVNIVPPNVLEIVIRNLLPATLYMCSVTGRTKKGLGQPANIQVWTLPEEPSPPFPPEIIKLTENTATLKLHESNDRTIRFYRLIVETHRNGPRKRNTYKHLVELNYDHHSSMKGITNTYITAQFPRYRLRGTFVIGDNRTYEGYYNGPLKQDQEYTIWLGAFSNVDGINQHVFVKADRPIQARSFSEEKSTNSVPVIIGVIIVFLLLIAISVVLLLLWRRRHNTDEQEKAEIPFFGPRIFPEPESSDPSLPMSKEKHPSIDNIDSEPLINSPLNDCILDSEPMYYNSDDVIAPIKVEDLWDYIRSNKQNDLEGLKREFKLLPAGITSTCEIARRNENKLKNRYGNIIAYDHTRVVLDVEGEDIHDDYINANYIDGYNKKKVYIAAQGPSRPTVNDIWRMAWKENSKSIIMLTNSTESGKKKCDQYWPDTGCEQYGNISVQLLNTDVLPDFTVRTFLISKGGQSKYLKQFHYTAWPDHGVPRFGHSLLLFRQKIRLYDSLDSGTLIVHCSAGVGRTGTYIAIDTQLEKAKSEGIIDVFNFVHLMRTQRVNMVQTLEQYVFVYDCLLEALICGDTTISLRAFPDVYSDLCQFDADISKTKLEEQFEILKLLSTTIERDESSTALTPENIFKNRCKNIIPANRCRPYLMTSCEGCNDYINAVFLNSYCKKDHLLVTQMPLPNTVTDFWRLIYDHKSYCIVMLNEVERNDDTCEQYWSEEPDGVVYGPFQVETTSEIKSNPIVTVRDFTVTCSVM